MAQRTEEKKWEQRALFAACHDNHGLIHAALFPKPSDLEFRKPRTLDSDLDAVCKAAMAEVDFQRLPFVLEARGYIVQTT